MTANMDGLDIDQLQALKQQADALIEKKQKEQVDKAYQQLLEIAKSVNLTLDELIAHGHAKKSTVKRSVAPRYRDAKNPSNTWTGRGKQPRWVVEALAAGATLDDLLI